MSDEALRELERQVAASPDDGVLRQQLLATYIRAGICKPSILAELAAIGDDAAIRLLDSPEHPSLHPKPKRFYVICAFVAYRLAYSEWLARYYNVKVSAGITEQDDNQLAQILSVLNSLTVVYLEGRNAGSHARLEFAENISFLNTRGAFLRGQIGHINNISMTAIMLLQVVTSYGAKARYDARIQRDTSNCISEACYTLRRLNRIEGIGEKDSLIPEERVAFFSVLKPEISRMLLPNYPPPIGYPGYRHLGL